MQVTNSIVLNDKTTPVLRQVVKAVETTITTMQRMDKSGDLSHARSEIGLASRMLDDMDKDLKQVNNSQGLVNKGFSGWKSTLAGVAGGIYTLKSAMQGLSSITDIIDENTSINARLNIIRDDNLSDEQLKAMVYSSAQDSRSSFADTGSSVAKLNLLSKDAFVDNAEVIRFSNLMQKSFKISGSSQQEQSAGMYQLTQAMAAGKLQGDEFRSIMENAPMLAQAIADFTGKSKGELKEMSAEGTITADIIKGSLFAAANDIESKYQTLPVTFGEVGTMFKNTLQFGSQGVLQQLSELTEGPAITNLSHSLLGVASNGVKALGWLGNNINGVTTVLKAGLIVWGSYKVGIATTAIANVVFSGSATLAAIQTHGFRAALIGQAGAAASTIGPTTGATVATRGLNTAMAMNPIGLVVMAIGGLVGALAILTSSYRNAAAAANEATAASANFLTVSGISDTDLSIDDKIDGLMKKARSNNVYTTHGVIRDTKSYGDAKTAKAKKNSMISWLEDSSDSEFNALLNDLKDGGTSSNKTKSLFKAWGLNKNDKSEMLSIMKKAKTGRMFNNMDSFTSDDFSVPSMGNYNIGEVGNVGNVDKVNDSVDISDESLRYLTDAMVRSYVNKVNVETAQPNFKIEFTGDINQNADADKIAEEIIAKAKERMYAGTDESYGV